MDQPLRILHLEDSPVDAELIAVTIGAEGIHAHITNVTNRREFESAISEKSFDLVLSDYGLPDYNGTDALAFARGRHPKIPFILLSGTLGEEQAVESLKTGATDYIVKQRLTRLGSAIKRAMDEARKRAEQSKAEEKLHEQAALLEKASDAILVCDMEGTLVFWNRGAQRIYGWNSAEAIGQKITVLLPSKSAIRMESIWDDTLAKGEWSGELQHSTKQATAVAVQSRWTCVRDAIDRPKSILIIDTDITEKKMLEAQFLRAQRMESIGILAGGIAHDLNNVLAPILMISQLLKMSKTTEEEMQWLDTIENSARHGAELIKQVLAFSRGIEGERIQMQISHLIRDLHIMLRDTFPKSIEVRAVMPKDLWIIQGVSTHLNQVMMNLCVNARDAMPAGGRLTINAENVSVDDAYARLHSDARVGKYVVVSVSDTGTGIASEILEKIYDPFFSTKEIGKGTGLGLSTVKGIVKSHNGFIHVYSELGKGTTFRVYLPAFISAAVASAEQERKTLPQGRGETILVVDDDEGVRNIIQATLQKFNYYVISAGDGVDGLSKYIEYKNQIDLVLTDMMMPLLDGRALIQALKKIAPETKIVALSGLVDSQRLEELEENNIPFIPKPFTTEQLLVALDTMLHG